MWILTTLHKVIWQWVELLPNSHLYNHPDLLYTSPACSNECTHRPWVRTGSQFVIFSRRYITIGWHMFPSVKNAPPCGGLEHHVMQSSMDTVESPCQTCSGSNQSTPTMLCATCGKGSHLCCVHWWCDLKICAELEATLAVKYTKLFNL